MFINRIENFSKNKAFKGYEHKVDNYGSRVMQFNYPYDYNNEICELEIYKVLPVNNSRYKLVEKPVLTLPLSQNGIEVDFKNISAFDNDEPFAYRFVRKDKTTGELIYAGADTGNKFYVENDKIEFRSDENGVDKPEYTFVSRLGTTPLVYGPALLTMPKVHRPGAYYDENGEIVYDSAKQKDAEESINHFSNITGGSLAGVHYDVPKFREMGFKKVFTNPIAGGDSVSHHGYWNQNNMQIAPDMANIENYNSFIKSLFQNGMNYVYDGTFTSEGLQGIHFQYALRWADKNPQSYYWFRMTGLKDSPLGFGVIPKNKENLRHRVINAPVVLNPETNKIEKNPKYDSNKATLFQIYDGSLITGEQESKLDEPIRAYKRIKADEGLKINTHDDTIANYIFDVDPKEYAKRLENLVDFNKGNTSPIKQNSADGTVFIAQFSNFKLTEKTEGGFVAWDANTDMAKMNFHISGYDEKINQSIVDPDERFLVQKLQERGAFEVQDMAIQAGVYWTQKSKDVQTLYSAQVLKGTKSSEAIDKLIENKLLPEEARLNSEQVANIIGGTYFLAPQENLSKDDFTVKSLMKLPLDSIEFANKTVGVLSTSYFSNRATTEETIGLNRFDLMMNDNPHLLKPYDTTYNKVNDWFKNQIKDFADEIIKEVDKNSSEKLIDKNGDYTEYGRYVLDLLGANITKYAILKSLVGDKLKARILPNGEITYNYEEIRKLTDLETLGIKAVNPEDEAIQLEKMISNGLYNLEKSDISFVASHISKQIQGTNVNSFRLAEAIVNKSGLGLDWRLDAAKDVIDMDAVRNGDMSFDDAWDQVIDFWAKFVKAVKAVNPNAYIVAEITDVDQLMRSIQGEHTNVYNNKNPELGFKYKTVNDAMVAFYNKTGVTSEAGYSYTFTDMLKTFSAEFEYGSIINEKDRKYNFMRRMQSLVATRGLDYIRNMFTFADNHDKPSVLHGMALDMGLFFSDFEITEYGKLNLGRTRDARIEAMRILTNSDSFEDMPLEAQLNIDNPDYFKTISSRAVAMSKLFRSIVNEDLNGIASKDEIKLLNEAIQDLTNGNYLGEGSNVNLKSIKIPELSSLENALKAILTNSNIQLSVSEFNAVIRAAKDPERIKKYTVYGDFNSEGALAEAAKINQERARKFLPDEWAYMGYSTYTVALTSLLADAFENVNHDHALNKAFINGGRSFIKKYDRSTIEANRDSLPFYENAQIANRKNGYAARDFETVIKMIINQANYIAQQKGQAKLKNTNELLVKMFRSSTEPAVQKAVMYAAYLSAFPGIPTVYFRNILGALGFDEKAKNVFLQNRNVIPWSQLEEGPLKEYRAQILELFLEAINIRNRDGVQALNNGTPYILETSNNNEVPAFLMQDAKGNMTVSVFNSTGIDPRSRVEYDSKIYSNKKNHAVSINKNNKYVPVQSNCDIEYIALGAGLALPVGLEFINSDYRDKAVYVVKKLKGACGEFLGIVKKGGGKISLNGKTAKNGVMLLKRISFKGNYNKQYNIVSNPYQKIETAVSGEKLSILVQ